MGERVETNVVDKLIQDGIKPSTAQKISEKFPDVRSLAEFKEIIEEQGWNLVWSQIKLEGQASRSLRKLLGINQGKDSEGFLKKDAGDDLSSLVITQAKEQPEDIQKWKKREIAYQKELLRNNIAFYGVSEKESEKELEELVDNLSYLRDFFGLFQMACDEKGAQIICSVLTPDGVLMLNELFFQEYHERPLPEKKKRGRRPKALLAKVGAPC